ncbi:hypothetical protein QBC34DRAFT_184436 [Podospora aff. communis PSN243]|uniref:Uncharacterized protein n=1 Tax=Podospora aff. communis PSN243 TaxID=3040156 RepID=A0AAV9G8I2_9PEZI|nr:hypothetical protein QBC34DRAFT_184436 [Podospora aff. communis PSN243]
MGTTSKRPTSPSSTTTTQIEPGPRMSGGDRIPQRVGCEERALAERGNVGVGRAWSRDIASYALENSGTPPGARSRTGAPEEHWIVQRSCGPIPRSSDKRKLWDDLCQDFVGKEGTPSSMTRMDGDALSVTPGMPRQSQGRTQTYINPGRRKETVPSVFANRTTTLMEPGARILSCQSPPRLIPCGRDEKATFEGTAQLWGGRRTYPVSLLSHPPVSSSPQHLATRKTGMQVALCMSDVVSLLMGYASTIIIVKSHQHLEDGWWTSLPLIEQLPSSLKHPSALLLACQYTIWCLIGIFHLLRSPRYWSQCGTVAAAISTAMGAWYGAAAMIDTVLITAFLSLVVAKAIDWAPQWRIPPAGVVLPLSKQDCKDEKGCALSLSPTTHHSPGHL